MPYTQKLQFASGGTIAGPGAIRPGKQIEKVVKEIHDKSVTDITSEVAGFDFKRVGKNTFKLVDASASGKRGIFRVRNIRNDGTEGTADIDLVKGIYYLDITFPCVPRTTANPIGGSTGGGGGGGGGGSIEDRVKELEDKVEDLEGEVDDLKSESETLTGRVAALETSLTSAINRIAALEYALGHMSLTASLAEDYNPSAELGHRLHISGALRIGNDYYAAITGSGVDVFSC